MLLDCAAKLCRGEYLGCRWCCERAVHWFCVGGCELSRVPEQHHGPQDRQIEDDDHPAQMTFNTLRQLAKHVASNQ